MFDPTTGPRSRRHGAGRERSDAMNFFNPLVGTTTSCSTATTGGSCASSCARRGPNRDRKP